MGRCVDCGAYDSEAALIFARRLVSTDRLRGHAWRMVVECANHGDCLRRLQRQKRQQAEAHR